MTGHVASDIFAKLKRRRGTMATLARALGVASQSIEKWRMVPLERVFQVSLILHVPPEQLRPDFFADDPLRSPRMPESWQRFGKGRQLDAHEARQARGIINGRLTHGRAGSQSSGR